MAAVLSSGFLTPAYAQSSAASSTSVSSSSSSSVAANADLACMSAAIDARETAIINARTTFNASVMAALNTRREKLKAAYTIANDGERRVAINAAWDAFAKAVADARAAYRTSVQASWKTFVQASVNCHIAPDRGVKYHRTNDDDNDGRKDRGLHLGWFKKVMKKAMKQQVNVDATAKSSAEIDLSF